MNQILVTKKIYVTPELKRKKVMYKINFFLSVFLVCILFSYYIYAEYDRNKNEEVSRQISKEVMASLDLGDVPEEYQNNNVRIENNVLIVTLDEQTSNEQEIDITDLSKNTQNQIKNKEDRKTYISESGDTYTIDAILNIPSLEINYPIISKTTDELLKTSLTKFYGGNANEDGNYVIVGHNYKNKKMFGRLAEMNIGDEAELTDLTGKIITYKVYDKYIVEPTDLSCLDQNEEGTKELTLITCTNYGTKRTVVKLREVL